MAAPRRSECQRHECGGARRQCGRARRKRERVGEDGLKGKITIARQPAAPLSSGKDDPSNVVFQQLIDRYQKEHPGTTIEWVKVPGSSFDELTQWITTRQASKNVPILSGHFSSTPARKKPRTPRRGSR